MLRANTCAMCPLYRNTDWLAILIVISATASSKIIFEIFQI